MDSRCEYSLIVDPAETEMKALYQIFTRKQTESILLLKKKRDNLKEQTQVKAEIATLTAELENSTPYCSILDYVTPGFFQPSNIVYKKQIGDSLDAARIKQQSLARDLEQIKLDYDESIKKIEKIILRMKELKKEIALPAEKIRQEELSPLSV